MWLLGSQALLFELCCYKHDDYNPNYCLKCGLLFSPLESKFRHGYCNYYFVLKHNNYRSALTTNVHTDAPHFLTANPNVPHCQPILEDI